MEVSIVKIGNSRGFRLSKTLLDDKYLPLALSLSPSFRLSKTLLDKYNIKDKVELILEKSQIIIKPVAEPRKGWDLKFKKMHENGDDKLLMGEVFEDENMEDWQ